MKIVKLMPVLLLLLLIPLPSSGVYYESYTNTTYDDTDYYYTFASSYDTWYIGEIMDVDLEIVVDYFGYYSYSFYDVEMFILIEDYDGFVLFEDSHFSYAYIEYDGDGIVFEWDIEVTADWPEEVYISMAADFYEETDYSDEFYSDDYIDMATFYIGDDVRPVNNPPANNQPVNRTDFPIVALLGSIAILVPLRKMKNKLI